jgi:uncharacterized protein YkwD
MKFKNLAIASVVGLGLALGACHENKPSVDSGNKNNEVAVLLEDINSSRDVSHQLVLDPALTKVSASHVEDILVHPEVVHVGTDGRNSSKRLKDANIKFKLEVEVVAVKSEHVDTIYSKLLEEPYLSKLVKDTRLTKIGISHKNGVWVLDATD